VKQVITSCTCDCPDTCSIVAYCDGGRITQLKGDPNFPITAGFLCQRSRGFLKRLYSPERILHPLKRQGTGWKRISWDEAGDTIARKVDLALREHGPLALYYFKDGGSLSALKLVNERFFNLLGGGTFASGSLCGGAGIAGQAADFGIRTSHCPMDLVNSRLIIIWGRNPAWTNVHLLPILRRAKSRGAITILIDPLRTATAGIVDRYVSLVPGTDAYLALGMARRLLEEDLVAHAFIEDHTQGFEAFRAVVGQHSLESVSQVTGVSPGEIRELALLYAENHPAAILGGWGLQRRVSGANTYRFLDALGALTGNIGVKGGGVSHGMDETRWFDKGVGLGERAGLRREIPRPRTGRGLLDAADPPVRLAFVSGSNPVAQCPNTGLVREAFQNIDLVVVLDMFMTDTAQAADIVLPTTHFLQEQDLVASYWHNYVMPVRVAQGRLEEEKTDLEIFALMSKKLGLDKEFPDDPDYFLKQLIGPLRAQGLSLEHLMEGPVRPRQAVDVPFADGLFPTASSRFEFVGSMPAPNPPVTGGYPYHLISPHPHDRNHSQIAEGFTFRLPVVHISRAAAGRHHLEEGMQVEVTTPQGALTGAVEIAESLRADTVVIYEGWWDRLGGSVNRLTPDAVSDMGLSATYYDIRCNLSKVKDSSAGGLRAGYPVAGSP
jgi:anaerobic selenocysteine-containing dehydrogenase